MYKINKASCEENFAIIFNEQVPNLGATKASLMRLLRSLDLVSWSAREESGRLDRKAFSRFATGSTNVFSRRMLGEAHTSAVSMLIDLSGSMHGGRIETAEKIAIQLAKILDKSGCEFSITGYTGDTVREYTGTDRFDSQEVIFVPFKQWNESLQKAAPKLGAIHACANGENPDYGAVMMKLEELAWRKENRKVLFYFTDAGSFVHPHMQFLQGFADKQGIKIVAIGIGHTEVAKSFRSSVNVSNLEDLASAAFSKLLSEIK